MRLIPDASLRRIEAEAVHYEVAEAEGDTRAEQAPADTVVLATGLGANPALADGLRAQGIEPIVIGDCTGVGYIEGAIHDGYHAALEIGEA